MSAEMLRCAAVAIREDYAASETESGEDDPFMYAVADWLDEDASMCEAFEVDETECPRALSVARAYLVGSA